MLTRNKLSASATQPSMHSDGGVAGLGKVNRGREEAVRPTPRGPRLKSMTEGEVNVCERTSVPCYIVNIRTIVYNRTGV